MQFRHDVRFSVLLWDCSAADYCRRDEQVLLMLQRWYAKQGHAC
jgi:hypothetical protein